MTPEKLIKDIEKLRSTWDECSMFKLKGVKNLSNSDLDTLNMYAYCVLKFGTWKGRLMDPMGSVRDVLAKYGMIKEGF